MSLTFTIRSIEECSRTTVFRVVGRLSGHLTSRVGIVLFVILCIGVAQTSWVWAEEPDDDLSFASLENILDTRLVASNVLGVHHTHPPGEWMISYRVMWMRMAGNRVGTQSVSDADVLQDFMVTPTDMDMQMHMLGVMFAPRRTLTLMAMVPYHQRSMNHLTRSGAQFSTESGGFGDIELSALYSVQNGENHQIHIESGVGLPTGSIDERADIPAGPNQRLPYPMQLGSGTYDPKLGLTYSHVRNDWYFGANTSGTWRLGRNDNNYRLGNQYVVDGWASYRFNPWLHSSARTVATFLGDIHGADPELNPMMVPTANPNLRGGKWVDILLGVNVFVPDGKLFGNRFSVEWALPAYQSLHGPQLERDWALSLGWQYVWNY